MGLAAIFTKYPKRNVEIDVLFSSAKTSLDYTPFLDAIKKSSYVNKDNIYSIHFKKPKMYLKMSSLEKNLNNNIKFICKYKRELKQEIKNSIESCGIYDKKYSEIYFCHEQGNLITTSLKFLYPRAKFIAYGDGMGLIVGASTKVTKIDREKLDFKFFTEIKPNEVVSLLPCTFDESVYLNRLPIK